MAGSDDEVPPPPPPQTPPQQAPHTVSTIKLPMLKKGEYDVWAMKMEHYLAHTDYPLWEVIQKGNGPVQVSKDTNGQVRILPPKTAEETLARERERKARTTLLMALPEDHLAKFHRMDDAKEMWDAIKSIFGGNDESNKMQKYILKQQFEGFSVSNSEGLHKGYDRFQSLLSQLEIHGAGVLNEDANQMFLRSLPPSWSQVSLVMRTKPGVNSLSFDDLYNNLRVFESDVKGSTASSFSTQNVAFISSKSTNNTNNVSTAYGASTSSGHNSNRENSSSYTDEVMYSFFASVDWTSHDEDEQEDFALMAYSNSGSDTKMSVKDKTGLGYGNQIHEGVLSYENEVFQSVFDNRSSDLEDTPVNDRYAEGMHVVPPPVTRTFIPSGPDREIDDEETLESMPQLVVNEPKVVSQPKVWSDAPIIEEYESNSDDDCVSTPSKEQKQPSFAFVNTAKHVKTPRETVKNQHTYSQSPKVDRRDYNGLMSQNLGLGYGFTKKACFVCGSFSHLIRDCDFHEKRMAKQAELNKKIGKGTGQRENRPV
ncbi:hypothetical protein Tco_1046660 [Tanacetum coccineum]